MDEEPAVIRNQMDQTRADLNEKLESLEEQVSETMQSTGDAFSDTMSSVRQMVQSVSHTLDIPSHVQRHPWIAVGTSVAAGFMLSRLLLSPVSTATRKSSRSEPYEPPGDVGRRSKFNVMGSLLGVMVDLAQQGLPLVINALLQPPIPPLGSDAKIRESFVPNIPPQADSASFGHKSHSMGRYFSP